MRRHWCQRQNTNTSVLSPTLNPASKLFALPAKDTLCAPLILAVVLAFSSLASANSVQVGTLTYIGHGKFQVDFTKALLVSNFQGLDMINGGYLSALPSSHTFQVGVGQQFCPCFSAGFDLVTSTGHNYLLTLPDLGNRWILGTSHNTMLGRFEPGDSRSINITTVPDN